MSLTNVLMGDLSQWAGLTGDETLPMLQASLAPVRVLPAVERIRKHKRYHVVTFERQQPPEKVEAWFMVGEDVAAVVEYDQPPVADLTQLLSSYGQAESVIPSKRKALGLIIKEHIYAERGLTLTIGTPYQATEGENPMLQVLHLELYRPMSVQQYLTTIENGPELRPYPPTMP